MYVLKSDSWLQRVVFFVNVKFVIKFCILCTIQGMINYENWIIVNYTPRSQNSEFKFQLTQPF